MKYSGQLCVNCNGDNTYYFELTDDLFCKNCGVSTHPKHDEEILMLINKYLGKENKK